MNKLKFVIRLGSFSLIILLLILLICISGYGVLLLPPVQNHVRGIAEKQLDFFLEGRVEIGRIRSNLLSRLDIHDLKIRDKTGRADSVSLGYLRVRYNLLALLKRTVHITSVFGRDLDAALSVTYDGDYKIPAFPDSSLLNSVSSSKPVDNRAVSGSSMDWKVVIGNVRINNVNAVYRDSCLHFTGSVYGAKARARFPRIDSMLLELQVPSAEYSSQWWEGTLDTIGGKAILCFDHLNLLESHVRGSGTEVHGWGKIPFQMEDTWDLHAKVNTEMAPVLAIQGFVPGVRPRGRLWAEASWEGTLEKPVLKYKTAGSGLKYGEFGIDSLSLQGGYTEDSRASASGIILSQLGKASLDAKIQIPRLMVNPSFGNYQGNIRIDQAKLPPLKEILNLEKKNIPGENASIDGKIQGCGLDRLPDLLELTIEAEDSLLGKDKLLVFAEILNKQWVIDAELGDAFIRGNGWVQPDGRVLGKIGGRIADATALSRYFLKERIGGFVKFESSINGLVRNPSVECFIEGKDLEWYSIHADSFNSVVLYDGEEVKLEDLQARFSANLDSLPDFLHTAGAGGFISATINACGPLLSPDLEALVRGSRVNYKEYRADTVDVNLSMKGRDLIQWKNGYIRQNDTEIKTRGEYNLSGMWTDAYLALQTGNKGAKNGAGEISVKGLLGADSVRAGFSISRLDIDALSPWLTFSKDFKGLLTAGGDFTGAWKEMQGKMGARLDQPGFRVHRLASIDCLLGLADSLLSVKSEIFLKDSSSVLHLDASLPLLPSQGWRIDLEGARAARIDLAGDGVNLEAIASVIDSGSVAGGIGNVRLEMFGDHGNWVVGGTVAIADGSYRNLQKNVTVNRLRFLGSLSGTLASPWLEYAVSTGLVNVGEARADSIRVNGRSSPDTLKITDGRFWLPRNGMVEIGARVPLDHFDSLLILPGFEIEFNIVKFPLVNLSPFVTENMIRGGEVNGKGKVRITGGRPVLSGSIGLENGKFAIEDMDPVIGPVGALFVMRNDSVLVNQLKGRCGKGNLWGEGFILWSSSGLEEMKIDVNTKDIFLDFRELAAVRIRNGAIRFTNKDGGGYLMSGNVELGDTRVVRDLRISDLLEQLQRNNVAVQNDPFLEKISMRIEVKLLENLDVDMNLGDLKLGGEVSITGTLVRPSYTGEIRVIEGFINYFDRKFELTRGSFYNYDPYKLDPLIDMEAVTEVDAIYAGGSGGLRTIQYDSIYLSIQGKLSEPEVRLWSKNMPMDEGNIISILTLGQPLGAIGGDLGDRLKIFAQQSLIGLGTRKLEQLLGIERINLKGNLFDFDSDNSPTLSLTKRFSPRFLLSYETALGDLTKPKVSAMFRLTRHFFVEGQTDADNYGLDLLFKYSR